MRLAGVLGQLERRMNNYDQALSYVQEGYGLAVKLENRPEQAEFKLDEARIQMQQKEPRGGHRGGDGGWKCGARHAWISAAVSRATA